MGGERKREEDGAEWGKVVGKGGVGKHTEEEGRQWGERRR